MELKVIDGALSVCKVASLAEIDLNSDFYFIGKTDEELSLVCRTEQGTLDFSLIGILSKLSGLLAERGVGIFAVSTYNTDYILVKEARFREALDALRDGGYDITE